MNTETEQPRSPAAKASWASLVLALGCACCYLICAVVSQNYPFDDQTKHGVLTVFYVLWAGEGLAVVLGVASFLLIRKGDMVPMAIVGIVARSLCGIIVGLFGNLVLWLVVGHLHGF
jgi:hypothetical protein